MSVSGGLALIFALGAASMDLLTEKVDNRLILSGWLLGLGYQLGQHGTNGMRNYFLGILIPLLLLYWLYWLRMLGPGDVKLFSLLGGIMGVGAVLQCIFFSFLFGGILSGAILLICGNFTQRLAYFSNYLTTVFHTRRRLAYYRPGRQLENIHFTVPILMGVMLYAGGFY